MMRPSITVATLLLAASLALSCAAADPFIIVQSTTSTQNSGLLDYLLPRYQAKTGVEVRIVAVGSGQALANARRGDGDVLLVHAIDEERQFVADGYGVERFDLMYNDFVVVGPRADPAGVHGVGGAAGAFARIAGARVPFVSRGDDSGTHLKELSLWTQNGIDVAAQSGGWYRETGTGMGATLNIASGMNGYALTDRATWAGFKNRRDLEILLEGDPALLNQYGVILVNPEKHPAVRAALGQQFIDWLLGTEGQDAIAGFHIDGQQVFFPNARARH